MSTIKLASWNVNGLRAIFKKGFEDWIHKTQPDIVNLQETKISQDQLTDSITRVKGYQSFFSHAERRGYSGVATYTKHTPLSVREGFGVKRFDCEGRTLIADFGDFLLFNVYFPNGTSGDVRLKFKLKFYEAFLKHLKEPIYSGKKIIICGDYNTAHNAIDLARPKANQTVSGFLPEERAWIDKLVKHGYADTFRLFNQAPHHYTWWHLVTNARSRNVGWRIDYFFASTNILSQVSHASIQSETMGSDHCPVTLTLEV